MSEKTRLTESSLKTPTVLSWELPASARALRRSGKSQTLFLLPLTIFWYATRRPSTRPLKGQVIRISPTSRQYVNPMDINLNHSDEESPIALKNDFILSFCEVVAGGRDGLQPIEKTVIDKAVRSVYTTYLAEPDPAKMPILEDSAIFLFDICPQKFLSSFWHRAGSRQ